MGQFLSPFFDQSAVICRGLQCLYESSQNKALPNEIDWNSLLPNDIIQELFSKIKDLNEGSAEDHFSDTQILDNPAILHEAIRKVAYERFPHFNIAERICPYKHLLNIYEAAQENSLSELTRLEINLLPVEIREQLFSYINEKNGRPAENNFGEIHVLDDPIILQAAIEKLRDTTFQEILQYCSQGDVNKTLEWIHKYPILDQHSLIKIAMVCAKSNAIATAEYIKKFDIKDPKALIEIAKLCAQGHPEATVRYINNFGIQIENGLIEIAKFCAQRSSGITAYRISSFGIQNQQVLIEIAKLCAQGDSGITAMCIKNFGIQDQDVLIEIAKLCAQQNATETAEYIKNFGIQDQTILIEIAKLCAQGDGGITAKYIKNFDIQDQNVLIEIAKLCAQGDGGITAKYIKNFDIQDQTILIEIAKLCTQADDNATARHIQNFGIQDKDVLIEIAKLCAEKSADVTTRFIQKFGIQDQNVLIEIAKLCAKRNAEATAKYINNFSIRDQNALIEIAKLCAQNVNAIGEYIWNFGIKDQNALIEIAKLCAQKNPYLTADWISHFGIQDQKALFEIAKLCILGTCGITAMNIKNFRIRDQQALVKIARLCAQKNPYSTAEHIQNFDIQSLNENLRIILLCAFTEPKSILNSLLARNKVALANSLNQLLKPLLHINNDNPSLEELKNFLIGNARTFIKDHISPTSPFLEQMTCLEEAKDIHDLLQLSSWLASMLFFIALLDPTQQELIFKTNLFTTLFHVRSPDLRQKLSYLLVEFALKPGSFNSYLEQSEQKKEKTENNKSQIKKALDFVLLGLHLISGVEKETTNNIRSLIGPSFHDKVAARSLLETLFLLHQAPFVTAEDKDRILQLLYQDATRKDRESKPDHNKRLAELKPQMRQRVFGLLAILLFQNEALMQSGLSITQSARATFQEKLHLNPTDEDFEAFQKLFMTDRNPHALMTYAAKLSSLQQQDVMRDLSRYINSVLKKNFPKERYQLENNPHLKTISEHFPNLLEQWKLPLKSISMKLSDEKIESFDPCSWLQNKVEHDHLNPNNLPHIKALLRQELVNEDDLLPIEKALKNLLGLRNEMEQITALESIQKELEKLPSCEFQNDVAGQLGILKNSCFNSQENVDVVDTDNYLDLLLCGTEVVGSCQNVNSRASLNKGLLGYLLDGKNRLMAVKNGQGKIIARAKLSLLWDGQKPALFLENMYTQGRFEESCSQAIAKMALAKAQSLGISLTTSKGGNYSNLETLSAVEFNTPLFSLGGGVCYEYVDACRGIQKDGIYEISADMLSELL